MPMLSIDNVFLRYDNSDGTRLDAIQGISLNINEGESVSIVGASGCGKSSLLYLMSGLLAPNSGTVMYKDRLMSSPHADIALILQDYGLFPWKTVYKNAALGLKLRGLGKAETKERVMPILEEMGIADKKDVYPNRLSGGERQRVAIARALAMNPKVLLMDEPFAALDFITQENMEKMVLSLCRQHRLTLIIVTHNIEEAVFMGERIAVFGLPGKITAVIDNNQGGEGDFHDSPLFYTQCNLARVMMGGGDSAQ